MTPVIEHTNFLTAITSYKNADNEGDFPIDFFNFLRANGLLKAFFSNGLPDESLSTAELLQVLKAIGRINLSAGRIFEGHVNALQLITLFASAEQRKKWHVDVEEQKLFGVWNTQAKDGVKIIDKGNGVFKLEGFKTFCSGADHIKRPLITGEWVSPHISGWQMFILPGEKISTVKSDPDFWKPLGMKASLSYRMDFTGIEITADDLLGQPGDYYKQPYFGAGAIRFAAVQLGGAEAILRELHHAIKSLGRTSHPFQQARMAEIICLTETGNLWIRKAGDLADTYEAQNDHSKSMVTYANMTRTVVENICLKVMQLAERSIGSQAFLTTSPLEQLHRDLTTYLRQPAPDAALTAIGEYAFDQQSILNMWDCSSWISILKTQ